MLLDLPVGQASLVLCNIWRQTLAMLSLSIWTENEDGHQGKLFHEPGEDFQTKAHQTGSLPLAC